MSESFNTTEVVDTNPSRWQKFWRFHKLRLWWFELRGGTRKPKATFYSSCNEIKVKDVPADAPQFEREYTTQLNACVSIKITLKTYFSFSKKRNSNGELNQSDGRWILFDPDHVADKILDPVLVPLIEQYIKKIYEMDAAFMAGPPNEFVDEHGTVWQRKGESK